EVKEHEPDAINSASLVYSKSREIIVNTNGVSAHRERDSISLSLMSQLINGNDILYVYDGQTITSPEINYRETLDKVLSTIRNSKALFQVNSKNMPVIFTPRAMSSLLIPLEPALSGKAVLQGSSYFAKKLDSQVMDSRVSIYEDPTQGAYNLNFDDEGIPAFRKPFIENGVLKNFYYDIQTAAEAGVQSTGNGFRSGLSNVSPAISTLVFEGGTKSFDEMVSEIEEGVIVEHVLGAGQGNTLSGAFSVNISLGFLIEKGKIVGRIKDCMVSGNTFESLNNIKEIEKDSHWLPSGTRKYPSIMFNNLNVVSKK
ncbi:MAG: metallopeptidase TldD-related protein, partial [Candidatus Sericytochromatia bacterium]